ncbi:MFS transporter [Campylobacter troglodytis]|uniref:MFS transporter n=1 Tax=Campylobacter troglodytis TaxID=654363 RepID=UPI001158867F|nr:MFS transporter [Campylobacter troglodytis]TQR55833.1 MFS transporter [Campylobacter troglodytis]
MLKSVLPLSFIISTRFFGLFIVLPVLSLYALDLEGSTAFLAGLLVGIYAFTQMFFQVPFGILSDKIGRKKALLLGLIIFIIGSMLCALANDIYTMMIGRALQGAGAIGAVASALISDFTKEEQRTRAMAIMGAFIGLAFCASMVLSPLLSEKFGLSSLFWLSALLNVFCIILLFTAVPKEPKLRVISKKTSLLALLRQKNLALMNLTNFMQKMLISIAFFLIPLVLIQGLSYPKEELWVVYLWAMVAGFLAMGFAGGFGERRGLGKFLLLFGVVLFALSFVLISLVFVGVFKHSLSSTSLFITAIIIFFAGFNLHEPIMQSLATKFATVNERGAALGAFNAFGYLGSFIGAPLSALMYSHLHMLFFTTSLVFFICLWFVLLCFLKNPSDFKNLYLPLHTRLDNSLSSLKGIVEIYSNSANLIIKYDSKLLNEEELNSLILARKD